MTLPVNPLTGDILGNPGQKAPETPRKEYNPGISIISHQNEPSFPFSESIPPGGRSTPIW